MNEQRESCTELWRRLVDAEKEFISARMDLFARCRAELVELVRRGLDEDRITALGVASMLSVEELQKLFGDLLSLASFGHGQIQKCRDLIVSLPKEWVLANIERAAEPLLESNEYEEYQRLLELYSELDHDLAVNLALRAAAHADDDIKEAGRHFLEMLDAN